MLPETATQRNHLARDGSLSLQGVMDIQIRSMTAQDAPTVSGLADVLVGPGYYPTNLVKEYIERSRSGDENQSFVACDGDRIVGFRFTFPPGKWASGRGRGLSPDKWPVSKNDAAYFQSCFVDEDYMGCGIVKRLSFASIDALRASGVRLVVAHSWKESPHNSSFRYLKKLGFHPVAEYPKYWSEIDYICKLDGKPCQCTAIEMILDLDIAQHSPPAQG